MRPVVRMFSASGAELGSFVWDGARLAGWAWTDDLELLLVEGTGRVSAFCNRCWLRHGLRAFICTTQWEYAGAGRDDWAICGLHSLLRG
jgi:hypothetical protein